MDEKAAITDDFLNILEQIVDQKFEVGGDLGCHDADGWNVSTS